MSISVISPSSDLPAFQPFQCSICQSRFTRHENLKRHAAVHTRTSDQASLSCHICDATFSRSDLRSRHLKRKHPGSEVPPAKKRRPSARDHSTSPAASPDGSQRRGSNEDGVDAISRYSAEQPRPQQDQTMINMSSMDPSSLLLASLMQPQGGLSIPTAVSYDTSLANFDFDQWSPDPLLSFPNLSQAQEEWIPSASQQERGCDLYFTHISNFLPFLHRPTFDADRVPRHLILSMLCLGYQHGEDPDLNDSPDTGTTLSVRCFHQARTLIAAEEEHLDEASHGLIMVQTYVLLQIYAMLYSEEKESTYGLKTHSKICSLARASGLMQPLPSEATGATTDLESLWRHFIHAESHKRTLFAIHQIDTLWYQFLSIPRSLLHLEIKHDLPCPETYWDASNSATWAHRQLIAKQPNAPIQYQDAVRRVLASDADLNTIPAFDPYATINIMQFLVSSAREISGWSTMTGILSMERLGPLRKSLFALSPLVRSEEAGCINNNDNSDPPQQHTALAEATWQAAMIEMQMWSPSHTGGIVGRSIDAALHHLIELAPSCEFLCEANLCESIKENVEWFLRYLDQERVPDAEAPWITLYAWKAFMIAWQLVKGRVKGAMSVVGVEDGDTEGAMDWARTVFGRRKRWRVGKSVLACLDKLGD